MITAPTPGSSAKTLTAEVIARIQYVTIGRPPTAVIDRAPQRRFARRWAGVWLRRCSCMHSGQITPTGAWVWHSGQIVRMHR